MVEPVNDTDRSILSTAKTVNAMRDAKYRHPANAIAELIDNSIDAFATRIELLVEEHLATISTRSRWRVRELAVLDNGIGMDVEALGQALRFGGRVPGQGVRKIGKYGMGLPTSSASQCKRLDVWTWQNGPANAHHAYLDIDQVQSGQQDQITTDQQEPPHVWLSRATLDTSEGGTLVVWSEIDRISQSSDTVFNHLKEEIGRTYRHYINDDQVSIRMVAYRDDSPRSDEFVLPNDPLYLMTPSNTPEPWDNRALFQPVADMDQIYEININGKTETVEVRYSMVKNEPDAIGEYNTIRPGNISHGNHARRNMGVSIVRENREIVIDESCVDTSQGGGIYPQNRWWGCEVRFNAGLDDLFGIDHNKQMAAHFAQLLKQATLSRGELGFTIEDELDAEADPLVRIATDIRRNITSLMGQITRQFKQRPRSGGHDRNKKPTPAEQAEAAATAATEESLQNQETTRTPTDDAFESVSRSKRETEATEVYIEAGYGEPNAKQEAELVVRSGSRYRFIPCNLQGHYVFQAESRGGVLFVKLNINHRFYQYLESLENDMETDGNEASETAAVGLRLAILAMARMEDEFVDRDARLKFQENTERWGRMLNRIIDEGTTNDAD